MEAPITFKVEVKGLFFQICFFRFLNSKLLALLRQLNG